LRITNVVQYYHPGIGGAVRFIRKTGSILSERGHSVHVLTTTALDNRSFLSLRQGQRVPAGIEEDDGCVVRRIRPLVLPKIQSLVPYIRPGPNIPHATYRALETSPDIIHVHCLPYAHITWSGIASRLGKIPLLVTPDIKQGMGIHPEVASCLRHADGLAVRSKWESKYLGRAYGILNERTTEVGMGVDLDIFGGSGKADLEIPEGRIIFFAGRLTREKGFGDLVNSLSLLEEDIKLVVAGAITGYAEDVIRRAEEGVRTRVILLGPIYDDNRLASLYRCADVVAYPSEDDSFGAVIIEAWAAGKPVVACRVGGPGYLISHWNDGLFSAFGNPGDLAEKLDTVISEKKLAAKLASRGHRKAKMYTWSRCTNRLQAAYESVLRR